MFLACATITVVNTPRTFGERLRLAREAAGYRTQGALAKDAGFKHQSAIGNMESGRNKGTRHVAHLAAILKVSPLWLEKGEGNMRPLTVTDGRIMVPVTSREELMLEFFKKLTPEQQNALLGELRLSADANRVTEKAKGAPVKNHVGNAAMEIAYGLPSPRTQEHPR